MPKYTTLPVASAEYERENEQAAEGSIEQSLQDIFAVEGNTNKTTKTRRWLCGDSNFC